MFMPTLDEFYEAIKQFELLHGVTILLSPMRAREIRELTGAQTREQMEDYFWKQITMTIGEMKARRIFERYIVPDFKSGKHEWDPSLMTLPDDAVVPLFPRKQLNVIIVGDPRGSNVVQGWSQLNAHSASIDRWR